MLDGTNALRVWHNGRPCEEYLQLSDLVDEHYEFVQGKKPRMHPNPLWMSSTVGRICPKIGEVLLIPRLQKKSDELFVLGFCRDSGLERICVAYNDLRTLSISETLYHELFHACEAQVSEAWRDKMRAKIYSRAQRYGDPDYTDTPIEQCARAFENFAMALDHGLTFITDQDEITTWMGQIYRGDWAKQVAIWAEEDRIEQAKRDRRQRIRDAVYELTGF